MGKLYSAIYVINIVFQSLFTLGMHIGASILLSWVFVEKLGAPSWIYAVVILIGVFIGLLSMIRFILSTMKALDSLEKSRKEKWRKNEDRNNEK